MRLLVRGDGRLDRWEAGFSRLSAGQARLVLIRALNRAGDSADSRVRTALSRQMGVKRLNVRKALRHRRAGGGVLEYNITGTGKYFSLIDAKGVKRGWIRKTIGDRSVRLQRVAAAAWNAPKAYPGAFMASGAAGAVAGAGATHIFARTSDQRFPLKKLWGPSVPREMERDEVPKTFDRTVEEVLPRRIDHELGRMLEI
ncbi:MAG: phage tail protein [Pseudomonadota bacterium]